MRDQDGVARRETWEVLQDRELQRYREAYACTGSYQGFFSIEGYDDPRGVGESIREACGLCLDVGCGVLPRPVYMREGVHFVGIDPFFGDGPRQFAFSQAVGEHLPFTSESFPCVSFMSTLDHQIEPSVSLREAYRVMEPNGRLYLWLELRPPYDGAYQRWRAAVPGTPFDANHQYAFTMSDVETLVLAAGFTWQGTQAYPGTAFWPPTYLICARKP